jgi:hypothetical protein
MSKAELLRMASHIMWSKEVSSAYTSNAAFSSGVIDERKVLFPVPEQLDKDIQLVFTDSQVGKEQARVEVFNGTDIQGFGAFRSRWLTNIGIDVIRVGDAAGEHPMTAVYTIDKEAYRYTIEAIQKTFNEEITIQETMPDFIVTGDVVVILGDNAVM